MKRLIYIVIAVIAVACTKNVIPTPPQPAPETTPQTTLMYMTGTDLSYFFGQNISAAKRAIGSGALGYGRFLVFKHTTANSATLYELQQSGGACVQKTIKEYSDIKSLTSRAIELVINDVKSAAPAESYNIIFSGHGTGWVSKEHEPSTWSAGVAPRPTSIWEQDYSNLETVTRYMGSRNDGFLNIAELSSALDAVDTHMGYILFDECFMSSIEVLFELREHADYIVASPCEIMGNGFPYDRVLPHLFTNYGEDFDLQKVCEEYYNYYSTYSFPSGCIALTDCSELDALADITREVNRIALDNKTEVDTSALQVYERLENHIFYDMEQYTLALCADDKDLSARYNDAFNKAFPSECRLHTDRFFANIGPSASSANNYEAYYTPILYYSGVTTSAPSVSFTEDWEQTLWARATK